MTKDMFKMLCYFSYSGLSLGFDMSLVASASKILFFYKHLFGIIFESIFIPWFQVICIPRLAGRKTSTAN